MITGTEFQKILRTINCLSYEEYMKLFGQCLGDHIWGKFKDMGIKFLFELDNDNADILVKHAQLKYSPQSVKFMNSSS